GGVDPGAQLAAAPATAVDVVGGADGEGLGTRLDGGDERCAHIGSSSARPGSVRTHERADADVDTEIMHVRGGFGKGGEEVEPVQAVESARPVQTLRDRIDAVVVGGG